MPAFDEDSDASSKIDCNLDIILEMLTPDKIQLIVATLYSKALDGNPQAAAVLLSYAAGEPKRRIELNSEPTLEINPDDGEEWKYGRSEEEEDV